MAFRAKILDTTDSITTINSAVVDLQTIDCIAAQCTVDVTTPAAADFEAGRADVKTVTFDTKANTDAGDYVVIYAQDGLEYAVAADLDGDDPEPTGAIWAAIPAGRKAQVDLTSATDAASVAAAFEGAFDGLTGFTAKVVTDDSSADGDMTFTCQTRGEVSAAVVKNADDSGAGSITVADTTEGIDTSVSLGDDTITIADHGLTTGLLGRLTSTGTLPGGLATATDYFVIVVDENRIQLANSLANALAGTEVDIITNEGTEAATHTFTATTASGSWQLQASNDETNWSNIGSASNFSSDGTTLIEDADVGYRYAKVAVALTAGRADLQVILSGKNRAVR